MSSKLSLVCLALSVTWAAGERAGAQSFTPEHPKVQEMVAKGTQFLTSPDSRRPGEEYSAGQPMLVGYTLLKVTGDVEHPAVKAGISRAVSLANSLSQNRRLGEKIVYEASIAAVLLASADSAKYQPELAKILYFIESIQKAHGGFGYLDRPTGDTSQVQYVLLALWTINEVGIDVPVELVENSIRYLRATMDPSGGWGYQGTVSNGRLVAQKGVTKSLATAGVCATLIAGDILGFYGKRKQRNDEDEGIPEAFVRIDLREKLRAERREVTMSRSDTDGAIQLATRYQNAKPFSGANWYYYWRYSQERYESFLEIVNGKQEKSPAWYNQGVLELAGMQDEDGSWGTKGIRDITPSKVSTSFAILFLIRSTQKAIGKLDEGLAFGGYELPTDVSTIKMVGDRIVGDEDASVENLLKMLEDDATGRIQVGLLPDNLQLTDDPAQRREQISRLSRLLDSKDSKARQIAAKLLGRTDDLNVVPDLIYALTDPNDRVPMLAEESLRLLSRKLDAGELEQGPTEAERLAAAKFWKEWYLGLRPDYIFVDR